MPFANKAIAGAAINGAKAIESLNLSPFEPLILPMTIARVQYVPANIKDRAITGITAFPSSSPSAPKSLASPKPDIIPSKSKIAKEKETLARLKPPQPAASMQMARLHSSGISLHARSLLTAKYMIMHSILVSTLRQEYLI